jgi:tetratricopeptide (TPR) repeat protein
MRRWLWRLLACGALVAGAPDVQAQDTLDAVRQLYASAAYEDALKMIARLEPAPSPDTARGLDMQRALCLLALGREADAERTIERLVQADPSDDFAEVSSSPRIKATFKAVRDRLVPAIARAEYERARGAFDAGDHAAARDGFRRVLALVGSGADIGTGGTLSEDLRVLASGFQALCDAALAPPPTAEPVPVETLAVPRIYDQRAADVTPPAAIAQALPRWPASLGPAPQRDGLLEIVIGEGGLVENAELTKPLHAMYDHLVLTAVRSWSFMPARRDGRPVKFRKIIRIAFE